MTPPKPLILITFQNVFITVLSYDNAKQIKDLLNLK